MAKYDMLKKIKQDSGLVIVEASIVFPVTFIVILFLLYTGNVYLQKCKVESLTTQIAIMGAACCIDPMLDEMESGTIPDYDDIDIRLYRYLISSEMDDVEDELEETLEKAVKNMSTGLFSGMTPVSVAAEVGFHNGFLYSTFSADVSYKITIPIRLLGQSEQTLINLSSHAEVSATDSVEFILNVNMVEDYVERFEFTNNIKTKITDAISKAKEWVAE
ncbi:MAG: pilus assembly protein [Lachnospiraceae bacterium]|nr:pilus assembly protein [Lachnospiraceae bacterium]